MYSFFIGSDVSKAVFDVAYHDGNSPVYIGRFSNEITGFKQFLKELKKHTKQPISSWFVCFENTGVYSKALLEWLISKKIPCREENALKISRSMGIKRGKDDKVDAKQICNYAFEKRDSIKPSILAKPLIVKLKNLLSRREILVKHKVALNISLNEQKKVMESDLFESFKAGNDKLIEQYCIQINEVESIIEAMIKENEEVKKNYGLIKSVKGIGPITAFYAIAFTQNFSCFQNSREFACYIGIAPFPNRSGTRTGKTKVSHLANKKIKSILSNGINSAIMHDKEIRMYYLRKINEGKEKGIVLNAVKNKIIHRVFAVVKRQSPYVPMMNYA